jgi:uncharacterized membrane protein
MTSPLVIALLRLIHILAGVFWVGGVLFLTRFLLPTTSALGPAAGPVMDHLNRVRRLPQSLLGAGFITVLSGFTLYWRDAAGSGRAWMASPTGMVFGAGGIFAILAVLIGLAVNIPTARRLGEFLASIQASGGAPSPEQKGVLLALQTRLGNAARAVAALLVLATAAMAVARYVS